MYILKLSLDSLCLEPGIIQCHVKTKTLQTLRQKSSIITPLNTVMGREQKKSILRYEWFKSHFEICISPTKKAFELNRAGLEEKQCWIQTLLMYIS